MVFVIFVVLVGVSAVGEYQGNPLVNSILGSEQPNLEGKEVRFGRDSVLGSRYHRNHVWSCQRDARFPDANRSLDPVQLIFCRLSGVRTGTAYLFIYLILTVFLTGLMVGRTPEFWVAKLKSGDCPRQRGAACPPDCGLDSSAITLASRHLSGISNPGFHGISQVVYEYASAGANNGSGFEGLGDNTLGGIYCFSLWEDAIPIIALLLLADSTRKQPVPETAGTLRTDSLLFTGVTAGNFNPRVLTFFPFWLWDRLPKPFKSLFDSKKWAVKRLLPYSLPLTKWTLQILTQTPLASTKRSSLLTQTYAEGNTKGLYQRA